MIFTHFLMVSRTLWEPLGVTFAVALVFLLLRTIFTGARKNVWVWLFWAGGLYAFVWRYLAHVKGPRYHNIFIFIGLFCIVGLWERFPLPRKWMRLLFIALLAMCLGRDLMYNPQDRKIRALYQQVEQDTRQFPRKMGLSYDSNGRRNGYYTKLQIYSAERPLPLADLLKNLQNNLSVYDGDWDAVYLFCVAQKNEYDWIPKFLTLAPEKRVTVLGECFLDTHHKKKMVVCRYRPSPQRKTIGGGEPIFNGDFAQLATDKEKQGLIRGIGKRMERLQTEPFEVPAGWNFYQSLAGKTRAFVNRVERSGKFALRLEADGFLAAIPKQIAVTDEKIISFTAYTEKDSMLQFTRAGNEIGMLPVLLLPLKAGTARRYEINLSPYANCEKNEIWFWLDHGIIELSDVRLK